MSVLQGYEPKNVLMYFEELSKIPRGSGNTKAVSNWLKAFGEQRGLETYQDELGDITIIKEASKGFEGRSPVILQGHMDMVCQKTPDCKKEMGEVASYLYSCGNTMKDISGVFERLYGKSYSTSQVNRLALSTQKAVLEWRKRALPSELEALMIDATYLPVRRGDR